MKMRVALYTDSDAFAGTERHMWELAHGLCTEGVAVSLACPSPSALDEAAREEQFPVLTIPKRDLVDWRAVQTFKPLLQSGQLEIIHAHNGRTALATALAVRIAGRGRCIMTQHFLEPNHASLRGPKAALSHRAHSWVTRQMSAIIAVSEAARAAILSRDEAPAGKITVIPNGIAAPDAALLTSAAITRRALNIAEDAPLIVCVARLEPEKDVTSLINAMIQVRAVCPSVRCLLVGDGSLRAEVESQIERLNLVGIVHSLGFRPDAQALIAAADIFVLPSLAEPFGLVLLEAMALGKPVIATQAGGPLEIVVDGTTGLLVPPSSPPALARAICCLLNDPGGRGRMGANGLARYQSCFTAQQMACETDKVYQNAMLGDF